MIGVVFLLGIFAMFAQAVQWSCHWSKTFMGEKYSQCLSVSDESPYPKWSPAKEVCPLHPTNAFSLATQAAVKAFPNVNSWRRSSLSLKMEPHSDGSDTWYFEVVLYPEFSGEKPEGVTCLSVVVGLDGRVPEIRKGEAAELPNRGDSGAYIRRKWEEVIKKDRGAGVFDDMTPYEKDAYIKKYQQNSMRNGVPPLPVPLTEEDNARLVKKGILPPRDMALKKLASSSPGDRAKEVKRLLSPQAAKDAASILLEGRSMRDLSAAELSLLCKAYNELGETDNELSAAEELWRKTPGTSEAVMWMKNALYNERMWTGDTTDIIVFADLCIQKGYGDIMEMTVFKAEGIAKNKDNMDESTRKAKAMELLVRAYNAHDRLPPAAYEPPLPYYVFDIDTMMEHSRVLKAFFTPTEVQQIKDRVRTNKEAGETR